MIVDPSTEKRLGRLRAWNVAYRSRPPLLSLTAKALLAWQIFFPVPMSGK